MSLRRTVVNSKKKKEREGQSKGKEQRVKRVDIKQTCVKFLAYCYVKHLTLQVLASSAEKITSRRN